MQQFFTLLGQIFLIACAQTIIEQFLDSGSRPYQMRIVNIACFLGSLYFLLNFISNVMIGELTSVFKFNF